MTRHDKLQQLAENQEVASLLIMIGAWSDMVQTEEAKQLYHQLMDTIEQSEEE